ncbi:hypothetical protein RR48_10088 [Papilio machaon]|uniref:Uncharacterized protein n=1 Tax=Papilio machaon TaxID=76193 RepID=A0A194QZD9_PAPMA|nr:hypothetical protein RR48_10088 [Papilio machaon]
MKGSFILQCGISHRLMTLLMRRFLVDSATTSTEGTSSDSGTVADSGSETGSVSQTSGSGIAPSGSSDVFAHHAHGTVAAAVGDGTSASGRQRTLQTDGAQERKLTTDG